MKETLKKVIKVARELSNLFITEYECPLLAVDHDFKKLEKVIYKQFAKAEKEAYEEGRRAGIQEVWNFHVKSKYAIHGECEDGKYYWIPIGHYGDPEPNCSVMEIDFSTPFKELEKWEPQDE